MIYKRFACIEKVQLDRVDKADLTWHCHISFVILKEQQPQSIYLVSLTEDAEYIILYAYN